MAHPGARIIIGPGAEVGDGTWFTASRPDAEIVMGHDVFISGSCIIAATRSITIGEESMIAELVSIRDHDHDPAQPPRSGAIIEQPVIIGSRVWIGAKASVLRGATVGDDAVVGAHALVNSPVPPNSLAVGVPATVVRRGIRGQGRR
jgi:acetyltransferase-like isoleucine patch superfamily enzyme